MRVYYKTVNYLPFFSNNINAKIQYYETRMYCHKIYKLEYVVWHFKRELRNVYYMTSINDCVDNFYVKILNAVEKSRFLLKLNEKNKWTKEWMTLGLLNSTRTKHELYKKLRKHPLNIN